MEKAADEAEKAAVHVDMITVEEIMHRSGKKKPTVEFIEPILSELSARTSVDTQQRASVDSLPRSECNSPKARKNAVRFQDETADDGRDSQTVNKEASYGSERSYASAVIRGQGKTQPEGPFHAGHDWHFLMERMASRAHALAKLASEQEADVEMLRGGGGGAGSGSVDMDMVRTGRPRSGSGFEGRPRSFSYEGQPRQPRSMSSSYEMQPPRSRSGSSGDLRKYSVFDGVRSIDTDGCSLCTRAIPGTLAAWAPPKTKKEKKQLKYSASSLAKLKTKSHFKTDDAGEGEGTSPGRRSRIFGIEESRIFGKEVSRGAGRFVLSPASPYKMVWDLTSTLVIGYDVMVLPLSAFGYDQTGVAKVFTMITTIFWTCDLVMCFFCGYHRQDGVIELAWKKTAEKYARSWFFPLDITVVSLDWALFALGIENDEAVSAGRANRLVRFFRILKVLRFTRIIRVAKLVHLFREMCSYILSAPLITFLNIVRLLVALSLFIHYIACAWFAIGAASYEHRESWVSDWKEEGISKSYFYVISYHWAMAQFMPAPVREHPCNVAERLFTIIVLFTGFVVFSSALGSVTALITATRQHAYTHMERAHKLRKFFMHNEVSHVCASRVLHFQAYAKNTAAQHGICATDLPDLQVLPASLKEDVMFEVYIKSLSQYPVIVSLVEDWRPAVKEMCNQAIQDIVVVKDDILFQSGIKALEMRFVRSGRVVYYPAWEENLAQETRERANTEASRWSSDTGLSEDGDSEFTGTHTVVVKSRGREIVAPHEYLSEGSLWTTWMHLGLAKAAESTRIITVSSDSFVAVAHKHPIVLSFCYVYAKLFQDRLHASFMESDEIDDTFRAFKSREELHETVKSKE